MRYLIGLDIGTSSVKGVLMNEERKIIRTETRRHVYYHENGFILLDPEQFSDSCFVVIKELASTSNGEIDALCASGASGNLMLAGKENSPIFGWQNSYDCKIVDKYFGKFEKSEIYDVVGWPMNYSFPHAALAYLRETNPSLIDGADMVCMSIEYLNYRLTGKWGITPSMGTPFFLIDQKTAQYNRSFLEVLGISEKKLPPIAENCSVLGKVTAEAALKTGLSGETAVVLGSFDHPAAARGSGVFDEGEVLISCGTSWVALCPFAKRETPLRKCMLTDPFTYPAGNWCGMASVPSISGKIDAATKKYFGDISYKDFDGLITKSSLGAGGLRIDLENPQALPPETEKRHIARAIAEAAAYKLKDLLTQHEIVTKTVKVAGGITNSEEWMSVISEVLGVRTEVVNGECAGAAGSALMAGAGIKIFHSEKG